MAVGIANAIISQGGCGSKVEFVQTKGDALTKVFLTGHNLKNTIQYCLKACFIVSIRGRKRNIIASKARCKVESVKCLGKIPNFQLNHHGLADIRSETVPAMSLSLR